MWNAISAFTFRLGDGPMWPRKQLDIGWTDLCFGLLQCATARIRPATGEVVGRGWVPPEQAVVTLSVRTGWDLLLTTLGLPVGSQVITSAVTIPDMVRIIEHHGLVPVPVGIDSASLEVDIEGLEQAITAQRGRFWSHTCSAAG